MKIPVDIRGTQDNFVPFYKNLDIASKLYKSITDTMELLRNNPQQGDHVAHNKIPTHYIRKYHITTLFRIELTDHWRLMYAIHSFDDSSVGILILEALDHHKYNKRFGYKSQ